MAVLELDREVEPTSTTTYRPQVRPAPAGAGKARYVWAVLRLTMGSIFLWAFLDKLLALGFATGRLEDGTIDFFADGAAAVNGGSATSGFLGFATRGPLAGFYQGLAGHAWVDWVFLTALLGLGLALILGIGMRVAAAAGTGLMLMMWSSMLLPENHPFLDEHLVYAIVLIGLAAVHAGDTLGLGRRWGRTSLVRHLPLLK